MDFDNIPDDDMAEMLQVPLAFASWLHDRLYGEEALIEWIAIPVPMEVENIRMGIFIVIGVRPSDNRYEVVYIVKPENQRRMEFSIGHADSETQAVYLGTPFD